MRRIGSSDSLGALISSCPTADEQSSHYCNFQASMDGLDEEGSVEEYCHVSEKKRRLGTDQVRALEKTFEVENKLEPERKVKLAQELGLQPRQVAVWFQNRRARWKTKQLERDYGVLKANYEALKANYETLLQDNEKIHKEVLELKVKLQEEKSEWNESIKEEVNDPLMAESNINQGCFKSSNNGSDDGAMGASLFPDNFKDGSSDSDSSAILNEDNSPNAGGSSPEILHGNNLLISPPSSSTPSASALNCLGQFQKSYYHLPQQQMVKLEEYDFFGGEEACNFFSDEQAPTLPWYCSDQWN